MHDYREEQWEKEMVFCFLFGRDMLNAEVGGKTVAGGELSENNLA